MGSGAVMVLGLVIWGFVIGLAELLGKLTTRAGAAELAELPEAEAEAGPRIWTDAELDRLVTQLKRPGGPYV